MVISDSCWFPIYSEIKQIAISDYTMLPQVRWFERNVENKGRVPKKEFFTSFLARDECYRRIQSGWFRYSPFPPLVYHVQPTKQDMTRLGAWP